MPPPVTTRSPRFSCGQHGLRFLLPLLLRADQQEVEDAEDQDERQELAWRCRACRSGPARRRVKSACSWPVPGCGGSGGTIVSAPRTSSARERTPRWTRALPTNPEPHRRCAGAAGPAAAGARSTSRTADAFVWHPATAAARAGARGVACRIALLQGRGAAEDDPAGEHAALRARPAGQQRHAVGRARHGQILAGEGGACGGQRRRSRRAGADRNPPRGHRDAARTAQPAARARRGAA